MPPRKPGHGLFSGCPGDRIFVRNGGGARITYPDGCSVPVRGFATVNPLSPCSISMAEPPPVVEERFPNWPLGGRSCLALDPRAAITLTGLHRDNFSPHLLPWSPLLPRALPFL